MANDRGRHVRLGLRQKSLDGIDGPFQSTVVILFVAEPFDESIADRVAILEGSRVSYRLRIKTSEITRFRLEIKM